jgi:PhnB protein
MDFDPYLLFSGDCQEALAMYATIFGGTVSRLTLYKDLPPEITAESQLPAGYSEKVMYSRFEGPSFSFMASDARPGGAFGNGRISLAVGLGTKDEAQRVFDALAAGGAIEMPLAPAFWGGYFGMLTDKFGIDWMINAAPDG